jgi:hypothetical protein
VWLKLNRSTAGKLGVDHTNENQTDYQCHTNKVATHDSFPTFRPISVECDALGTPLSFRWEGQTYIVDRIYSRYRVDKDWLKQRIWREHFKLLTASGVFVVIYRDFLSGKWFIQRIYD